MNRPIAKLNIDVKKINKDFLFVGAKGTYMDVALWENKDGRDQYGNDGMITQDVPMDAKKADPDLKGPILGNFKYPDAPQGSAAAPAANDDDDIPF